MNFPCAAVHHDFIRHTRQAKISTYTHSPSDLDMSKEIQESLVGHQSSGRTRETVFITRVCLEITMGSDNMGGNQGDGR